MSDKCSCACRTGRLSDQTAKLEVSHADSDTQGTSQNEADRQIGSEVWPVIRSGAPIRTDCEPPQSCRHCRGLPVNATVYARRSEGRCIVRRWRQHPALQLACRLMVLLIGPGLIVLISACFSGLSYRSSSAGSSLLSGLLLLGARFADIRRRQTRGFVVADSAVF